MSSAPIHPTNLDIFDGGPPVDRKNSNSSGSMNSGTNDKQYYSEHDFDDMIAGVIEPTKRSSKHQPQQQQEEEEYNEYEQDRFSSDDDEYHQHQQDHPMVDMTPNDHASASEEEEDAISLNSDDISGGSDISDVEQQRTDNNDRNRSSNRKNKKDEFQPRPLINDDESTVDMRPPAPVNQSVSSYVEALNQQQTRKTRIIKLGMLLIFLGVIIGVVLGVVSASSGKNNGDEEASSVYNGGDEGSGGGGLESNQISVKESFTGNGTTYSPSISPVYYIDGAISSSPVGSSFVGMQSQEPTMNPRVPPVSATLPTVRPTLAPMEEVVSTNAPVVTTEPPVTAQPTPEVCIWLL
jgi:hypothetical protein